MQCCAEVYLASYQKQKLKYYTAPVLSENVQRMSDSSFKVNLLFTFIHGVFYRQDAEWMSDSCRAAQLHCH